MTARKTSPKRSTQAAPAAGSPARPLGGCYAIEPGGPDGAEHFSPPTLATMSQAVSRAMWLSCGGPDQRVIAYHPGQRPRPFYGFSHGQCTMRPACVTPAQRAG